MKLWVVGVGPGDPELITVKASLVLRRASLVFAPLMGGESESRAYEVAKAYLPQGCTVVRVPLDAPGAHECVVKAALRHRVSEAVFLVLGDPGLYGSCLKMLPEIRGVFSEIEVIPGISAHQVMSARLLLPLAQGDEALGVVPGTIPLEVVSALSRHVRTLVVYKPGILFRRHALVLERRFEGWVGEYLATPAERIVPLSRYVPPFPYFSLLFLRRVP